MADVMGALSRFFGWSPAIPEDRRGRVVLKERRTDIRTACERDAVLCVRLGTDDEGRPKEVAATGRLVNVGTGGCLFVVDDGIDDGNLVFSSEGPAALLIDSRRYPVMVRQISDFGIHCMFRTPISLGEMRRIARDDD